MRPGLSIPTAWIGLGSAVGLAMAFGLWAGGYLGPARVSPLQVTNGFGPALGASEGGRMPAEFEHHDALMLGFNELADFHPQALADIVRAIGGRMEILGLIARPEQEGSTRDLLESSGVATDHVHFFLWPAISMWVRDFGPRQLVNGHARVIDFDCHHAGRDQENQLPMAFAATFGMKIAHCKLTLEGGDFLSNGRGWCVSSAAMIDKNKNVRQYDVATIGRILKDDFNFSRWTYLMPIDGEPTGHLDMFLTIADPTTVVLASYEPEEDPENAARMDGNAEVLSAVRIDGKPLRIVRIPSPAGRDGVWRSYTNVIYANGVLLVPQHPDHSPELDRRALEIYRAVLPTWQIVGIDASTLVAKRCSLHCLSLSLPVMPTAR